MIENLISAAVGGLVYGLSGIAKSPQEKFDPKRLGATLAVSVLIGLAAGFLKVDYGTLANTTMSAGLTMLVENVYKAIAKRLTPAPVAK